MWLTNLKNLINEIFISIYKPYIIKFLVSQTSLMKKMVHNLKKGKKKIIP